MKTLNKKCYFNSVTIMSYKSNKKCDTNVTVYNTNDERHYNN